MKTSHYEAVCEGLWSKAQSCLDSGDIEGGRLCTRAHDLVKLLYTGLKEECFLRSEDCSMMALKALELAERDVEL